MKVLVVSVNVGSTKSNIVAPQDGHDVSFICYNDSNFPGRRASFTPRMNAKIPKMLAWELNDGFDYYIWMDSYFNMNHPDSVDWFIKTIGNHDALFFKHPSRSSILDEAKFMIARMDAGDKYITGRINAEPIMDQVEKYLKDSTFSDNILIAASCFCYSSRLVINRRYNPMKEWFYQVCMGSIRDQLSLPYILHTFNVNYKTVCDNVFSLKYLK